ncbi:MAG TPA: isoprenylcysteine carboxylmethyltransferase family protein [Methylomirabilota bacterium]|nr:isoprenylcysteine carboxylmethyltransferase family protein [Methylomirabilota bacterium]
MTPPLGDTRVLFTALVGLVAVMRLVELAVSRRNIARLEARGAVEVGARLYPWMVAVHASFLLACVAEVWLLGRPFVPLLGVVSLGLLAGAAALRWWVIATLGDRWSTRVLVLPEAPPVTGGPFRHLRHPNYLAVVVEFLALPMVHSAWLTAVVFSAADAAVLWRRIRTEEAALAAAGDYRAALGDRPRFIPGAP